MMRVTAMVRKIQRCFRSYHDALITRCASTIALSWRTLRRRRAIRIINRIGRGYLGRLYARWYRKGKTRIATGVQFSYRRKRGARWLQDMQARVVVEKQMRAAGSVQRVMRGCLTVRGGLGEVPEWR